MGPNEFSTLKINFEVFYLTQFSIFLEKNKIKGYRLFNKNIETIGIGIFQFHK